MCYCCASRPGPRRATKLEPRGEVGVYLDVSTSHGRRALLVYSPRTSRVYATVDARFDETYFPFRTTNQRVYGQDYSRSIQLEQLSLYHDMPNPTVARIVERLQSTAVPCSTAWDIHDLLQLPRASRSSGRWILKPCAAGTSNPASAWSHLQSLPDQWGEVTAPLKDFFLVIRHRTPFCKWSASSVRDSGTVMDRRRKQDSQEGRQQHSGRVSHWLGG